MKLNEISSVLITGGTGFIGHHLVEHIMKTTNWNVTILDRLDTASTLHRLTDIVGFDSWKHRITFVWHDLKAPINEYVSERIGLPDVVFHLAASSHVDRSIEDPTSFVMDNVLGTANLLDHFRRKKTLFFYFSTDEVFGDAPDGTAYKEWDRYNSRNPYAASKAGAEELAVAFANTYKMDVIITHTMNVFGERQHPEKFIPKVIRSVRDNRLVQIHSHPDKQRAGQRMWIHARNVAAALLFLVEHGKPLDGTGKTGKYNIVGEVELDNKTLALMIADMMKGELKYEMTDFHSSRPGHDLRYALDGSLMNEIGWEQPKTFAQSLLTTVKWYLSHPKWL